jgi:integrase
MTTRTRYSPEVRERAVQTRKRDVQRSFNKLVTTTTKTLPSLYDVTPHTMRKTFGSWAVQSGATLKQVKELLGHSTIMITERHYAYLAPRNLQDAISKLEGFCNENGNENNQKAY